jgi:hypothetical protein
MKVTLRLVGSMHEYEIRVLSSGHPIVINEAMHLSDHAAVKSARDLAGEHCWRQIEDSVTFTFVGKAETRNAGVCELGREYSNAHEAWAASGRMVRDGCQDVKILNVNGIPLYMLDQLLY